MAYQLSYDCYLREEVDHIKNVLRMNGYPKCLINRIESDLKHIDKNDDPHKPLSTAVIPYVTGTSKILWDYGIRTAFKTRSLAGTLTKVKDPIRKEEKTGTVYKISCDCGDFYIGESCRSLSCRVKEHQYACKFAYVF